MVFFFFNSPTTPYLTESFLFLFKNVFLKTVENLCLRSEKKKDFVMNIIKVPTVYLYMRPTAENIIKNMLLTTVKTSYTEIVFSIKSNIRV